MPHRCRDLRCRPALLQHGKLIETRPNVIATLAALEAAADSEDEEEGGDEEGGEEKDGGEEEGESSDQEGEGSEEETEAELGRGMRGKPRKVQWNKSPGVLLRFHFLASTDLAPGEAKMS